MKIAHLTSVHPRYDARIFLKECRSLATSGHEVILIVADGNGDEVRDGVRIIDVGKLKGRATRMFKTVNKVYEVAKKLDADIYHLHDPELLRVARSLMGTGEKSVLFDAHEDMPRQILAKQWIPRPFRPGISWAAEIVEDYIVRRLSGVVAATPHIADRFERVNNYAIDINNYPLMDELAARSDSCKQRSQICYIGGLTQARGIESLIQALPLMPDVVLALCGQFQEKELEDRVRALPGWEQVDYRGYVDRKGVQQVLNESVVGIVTLLPTPAYIDALPVKMFEYMSAGLPVVASNFPLWREIIEGAKAGLCVDPQSPEAIAKTVRQLLDEPLLLEEMGRAGRSAVVNKYNWSSEAVKLKKFYDKIANRPNLHRGNFMR